MQKDEPDGIIRIKEMIQRDEPAYINEMMKEIRQHQPFLLSFCGGVIEDTTPAVANDLAQIILLVWGFFRQHRQVWELQVTPGQFERVQNRSISMLQYGQRENPASRKGLYGADINKLRSAALFADIALDISQRRKLALLDRTEASIIALGFKCLVECFDGIVYGPPKKELG
jgi:hypothetical protein